MKKDRGRKWAAVCLTAVLLTGSLTAYASAGGSLEVIGGGLEAGAEQQFTGGTSLAGEEAQIAAGTGISDELRKLLGGIQFDEDESSGTETGQETGTEAAPADLPEDAAVYTFDESTAPYAGTWVNFADGFRLYLPSDWNVYEPSEEQKTGGCLYQAGDVNAGMDPDAPYIFVNYGEAAANGITTLDDLVTGLENSGYGLDGIVSLNGIPCAAYHLSADDLSGMMFFGPEDHDYVFAVIGYNCTENMDLMTSVLMSLSLR